MAALVDKIREARKATVEVGAFKFMVRRPTDLEMIEMRGTISGSQLMRFVLGWEGVAESDIVEQGDPHPATFSLELATEWLSDRPDLFSKIAVGIVDCYKAHTQKLEDASKNSQPG